VLVSGAACDAARFLHRRAGMERARTPLRLTLALLLAFGALNAVGGAFYGLAGARGVPTDWLRGSPFRDYFVPSFVLLVVVGGALLHAAVAVTANTRLARPASLAAGVVLLGWMAAQIAIVGYVSWLQPATAAAALVVIALATALPRVPSDARATLGSFFAYYAGMVRRPRATLEALMADPRRLRLGAYALLSNAALYTLVYVFLVMGRGRPTAFAPWLAIAPDAYYRYDVFLLAPSTVAAWLLAGAVVQLVARRFGGAGTFEDTLSGLGFATAVASWCTLGHDLVTSCLGAFGVIDQRAYEDAMSSPTPFRTILWALMIAYLIAFVVLFAEAIAAAQRVRPARAAWLGALGFVVYQGVFVVFNR
jgi:hypothetical protein